MRPKELVQEWVTLFNQGKVNELAQLYHEDAMNHQVANDPIYGRSAIKAKFHEEFNMAEMTCIVENLFEDGDWAILEWKDPTGLRGCGFFQVLEGKIVLQRGYWDKLTFMKTHRLAK